VPEPPPEPVPEPFPEPGPPPPPQAPPSPELQPAPEGERIVPVLPEEPPQPAPEAALYSPVTKPILGDDVMEEIGAFTDCPGGPNCRGARAAAEATRNSLIGLDPYGHRTMKTLVFLTALADKSPERLRYEQLRPAFPALREVHEVIAKIVARSQDPENPEAAAEAAQTARKLLAVLVRLEIDARKGK
jgi:hypothetical protein